MTLHEPTGTADTPAHARPRAYGVILLSSTLTSAAFMAMHPRAHYHDMPRLIDELARGAAVNGLVHGTLITAGCAQFLGLTSLTDRLGPRSPAARGALIAFAAGQLTAIAAAAINGFIIPRLASRCHDDDPATLEALRPLIRFAFEASGVMARFTVFAVCAAIILWAWSYARRSGFARAVSIAGLICGGLPLALLLTGRLPMSVHGFGAFMLLYLIWCVIVSIQLIRDRI